VSSCRNIKSGGYVYVPVRRHSAADASKEASEKGKINCLLYYDIGRRPECRCRWSLECSCQRKSLLAHFSLTCTPCQIKHWRAGGTEDRPSLQNSRTMGLTSVVM